MSEKLERYTNDPGFIDKIQNEQAIRFTIKAIAIKIYSDAYKDYYKQNPEALRYNLCLLTTNKYFKSAILLAKKIEKIYEHFVDFIEFTEYLKANSDFYLVTKNFNSNNYLCATLNGDFYELFERRTGYYMRDETEEDVLDQAKAKKKFMEFLNKHKRYQFLNIHNKVLII